jgi:hypothetical protein
VNVLDENVPRDQADLLRQWGVRFRSISRELGYQGIDDEDIRPLLLRLKKPTLLTRDEDFFRREFAHARYCLVWFDVAVEETSFFIRRFLHHRRFRANAKRLGCVIHVQPGHITYWTWNAEKLAVAAWED